MLAEILKTNDRLRDLDLAENQIQDVSALAAALKTITSLERLDMGQNKILDISALAEAPKVNTSLVPSHWLHTRPRTQVRWQKH